MKTIIWDWNGTLLSDVQVSYDCLNRILAKYNKPLIATVDAYRAIFGFPVKDYYARAGIDGALFDEAAPLWMDDYMRSEIACGLMPGAREALAAFHGAGYRQIILSASKRENLLQQIARFHILPYFDTVLGLSHIYATSKEGIGRAWMAQSQTDPGDCVMIGDTLHDADVARALGCRCMLVCGGHQLPDTLKTAGCAVTADLWEAAERLIGISADSIPS
ncbi:MAG: HAD family hydrolase [Clostridia bacterium]|nr:HAD family hydrolase [Clostridia bacterium]